MAQPRITRRSVLGSVGASTLAPALATGARAGLREQFPSDLPISRLAFAVTLRLDGQMPVEGRPGDHGARIVGGEVSGPAFAGSVQGGRIDWRARAGEELLDLTLACGVLTADGRLLELRDLGTCAAGSTCLNTSPSLQELSPDGLAPPLPLLVGRLDTSRLAAGEVRLLAYEVSLT